MIKAYGQTRDVQRVWALWRKMRSRGLNPTAINVDCTADAIARIGQVREAWSLAQDLTKDVSLKQHASTVIYSTVLKGCVLLKPSSGLRDQ